MRRLILMLIAISGLFLVQDVAAQSAKHVSKTSVQQKQAVVSIEKASTIY